MKDNNLDVFIVLEEFLSRPLEKRIRPVDVTRKGSFVGDEVVVKVEDSYRGNVIKTKRMFLVKRVPYVEAYDGLILAFASECGKESGLGRP